ncbi:hypothetical protein ACFSR6_03355 [Pedobacter vanadiisoli]|uniref:Uncharacterized protein n=1 Tax=Pedobacter vanadiisoli TaxID=1761975 RepID=A0ABW5MFK4_9SPHI
MTKETGIPKTLNAFGKEWCLQGEFTDLKEMETNRANWIRIGHKAMIKNKNRLYVTRFRQ